MVFTGVKEALDLRDEEKENYHGKSVTRACKNINDCLGPMILKQCFEVTQQTDIDNFMIKTDGTDNKARIGGNAILAISIACCKAAAAKRGLPVYRHIANLAGVNDIVLPVPIFNMVNGGAHAGNKMGLQEFMIMPTGANNFKEAMKMGMETYMHLRNVIKNKYGLIATLAQDVGGFAPPIQKEKDAVNMINEAIKLGGYTGRIEVAIDAGASQLFKSGKYDLDFKNPKSVPKKFLDVNKLLNLYRDLIKVCPIVSIEDPYDKDSWSDFAMITEELKPIQIVTDEMTVSSAKRLEMAIQRNAGNCFVLKMNQLGTITETINNYNLAKSNNWSTMISARAGDTEDSFIAELVVGLSNGQFKGGAPCRSDRLAKYNQILRIEEELGEDCRYAGTSYRNPYTGILCP